MRRLSDELEAKNRELARKNRLADLGQMASHVAHEVRNSLVPMKLYLSLLRRRIDDDRGSLDVLDKVMAGFTALEATVGDLLHFSSQRDPRRERVDRAGCWTKSLQSLAPQLARAGHSLLRSIARAACALMADARHAAPGRAESACSTPSTRCPPAASW